MMGEGLGDVLGVAQRFYSNPQVRMNLATSQVTRLYADEMSLSE